MTKLVKAQMGDSVPVSTIIWSANAQVPARYLLCNGAAVGRLTYPDLFAAIDTTYGTGDGTTTFNLPNLIGKFIEGSNIAGVEHKARLPNITGTFVPKGDANASTYVGFSPNVETTGALNKETGTGSTYLLTNSSSSKSGWNKLALDASLSNSIYGNSTTVQPPSITALPCIKAFSSVVGNATVIAGQLINDVNSKVVLDGSNLTPSAIVKTIIETWNEGTEWYRVWSDGFIE